MATIVSTLIKEKQNKFPLNCRLSTGSQKSVYSAVGLLRNSMTGVFSYFVSHKAEFCK